MLPTSLSNWLSPKVDLSSGRRRRRDSEVEIDQSVASSFQLSRNINDLSVPAYPPPTKRQKTLEVNYNILTFICIS